MGLKITDVLCSTELMQKAIGRCQWLWTVNPFSRETKRHSERAQLLQANGQVGAWGR